jgi:RNA polymerase sigma-70 factor (ECF subfamily)
VTSQLADQFEADRPRLRAVAYRMLGSLAEADDAVQETWLRASRADSASVENVRGWLTTIISRVCLNVLRSRRSHPEEALDVHVPDPIVDRADGVDPEHEVLLADSIGMALQVVLDALTPAERLAFVLHDVFGMPFAEIAPIAGRSSEATRQLASRARRRVRGAPGAIAPPSRASQEAAVGAFLSASRQGDFDALVALLAPDVVIRSDGGPRRPALSATARGADVVAAQALMFSRLAPAARRVLVNGAAGALVAPGGKPFAVMAFTVADGRIAAIDILADPDRLAALDLSVLDD